MTFSPSYILLDSLRVFVSSDWWKVENLYRSNQISRNLRKMTSLMEEWVFTDDELMMPYFTENFAALKWMNLGRSCHSVACSVLTELYCWLFCVADHLLTKHYKTVCW